MPKRPGLRVPKKQGSKALETLRHLNLLDSDFHILTNRDSLVLPLHQMPDQTEMQKLGQYLSDFEIEECEFKQRPVEPDTVRKALELSHPLINSPVSFDIIGDIAILEVDDQVQSDEKTIANTLMRVHRNVHGVFAKAGPIIGSERIRPLRHIAGESKTVTLHREHGCNFKMDLSQVYFSPRLSTEHLRVAKLVQRNEKVLDMFAGIGPFSILIAKLDKTVNVNSIDSNPNATRFLEENVQLNKVKDQVTIWEGDASKIVSQYLTHSSTRIIMNHPTKSHEFIPTAIQALAGNIGIIHYYTFTKEEYPMTVTTQAFRDLVARHDAIVSRIETVRRVREIAPFTWQIVIDAEIMRKNQ